MNKLIDLLGEKCDVKESLHFLEHDCKADKPILIGDVLFRKPPTLKDKKGEPWAMNPNASKIIALWEPFGNVSLQEIYENSVWDEDDPKAEIKFKPAQALNDFLEKIFITK